MRTATTFSWVAMLTALFAASGCRPHTAEIDAEELSKPVLAEQMGVLGLKPPTTAEQITAQRPILSLLGGSDETGEPTLPDTAASALARIGPDAVPGLVTALGDHDAEVRADAARSLALMGPKASAAVPALIHALADPDDNVERSAARALGQIGPAAKDAVPSLLDLLRKQKVHLAPAASRPAASPGTLPAKP